MTTTTNQMNLNEVKGKIKTNGMVCDIATNDLGCKGYEREYQIWHSMINRCYRKVNLKYLVKQRCYINCTVCDRWLTFSNFVEDIQKLEGYDAWKKGEVKMALDKDKLQVGKSYKVYSPSTCCFLTMQENAQYCDYNKQQVVQINLKDYSDITLFAEIKHIDNYLAVYRVVNHNYINRSVGDYTYIYYNEFKMYVGEIMRVAPMIDTEKWKELEKGFMKRKLDFKWLFDQVLEIIEKVS